MLLIAIGILLAAWASTVLFVGENLEPPVQEDRVFDRRL